MTKPNARSGQAQDSLPHFEPETERLVGLPAWQRAKLYEIAGIGFAERSMLEAEVRARIAADFGKATR
jgi:hypothetical protein